MDLAIYYVRRLITALLDNIRQALSNVAPADRITLATLNKRIEVRSFSSLDILLRLLRVLPVTSNGTHRMHNTSHHNLRHLTLRRKSVRRVNLRLRSRLITQNATVSKRTLGQGSRILLRNTRRIVALMNRKLTDHARGNHTAQNTNRTTRSATDVQIPPKDARTYRNKGRMTTLIIIGQDNRLHKLTRTQSSTRIITRPIRN